MSEEANRIRLCLGLTLKHSLPKYNMERASVCHLRVRAWNHILVIS